MLPVKGDRQHFTSPKHLLKQRQIVHPLNIQVLVDADSGSRCYLDVQSNFMKIRRWQHGKCIRSQRNSASMMRGGNVPPCARVSATRNRDSKVKNSPRQKCSSGKVPQDCPACSNFYLSTVADLQSCLPLSLLLCFMSTPSNWAQYKAPLDMRLMHWHILYLPQIVFNF